VLLSTSGGPGRLMLQLPTGPEARCATQDLEVEVGKLILTCQADPVLRGASE
jgi:hypothetical protein